MKTRREVIAACMAFENVYEDYPFDENWTVMRHSVGNKAFALIYEREGKIWVNVKQPPEDCFILRELYPSVLPAYHMNKRHWVSIVLDGSMKKREIVPLLKNSYDLTAPRLRRAKRAPEE